MMTSDFSSALLLLLLGLIGVVINLPSGSSTLTGAAPARSFLGPRTGQVSISGLAPSLDVSQPGATIDVPAGSLTVTGFEIAQDYIGPAAGSLTITGLVPAFTAPNSIAIPDGLLTVTGQYITVRFNSPSVGTVTITGYAPTVQRSMVSLAMPAGTLGVTGLAPTLPSLIEIPAGSLDVTGAVVEPSSVAIHVPVGTVTWNGEFFGLAENVADGSIHVPVGSLRATGTVPMLSSETALQVGSLSVSGRLPAIAVFSTGTFFLPVGSAACTGYAPAVEIVRDYPLQIQHQFTEGVWTTNRDVLIADGLSFRRGIQGRQPDDRVASAGTLSFTVNNETFQYSGHQPGFTYGLPTRVIYKLDDVEHPLWTGRLTVIDADAGVYGTLYTRCGATSTIVDLLDEEIQAVAPQVDRTEVQLLEAVDAALPVSAQPAATDYDPSLHVFKFALDDLESGTVALTIKNRIVTSAQGFYIETGDGTHRYVNSLRRALGISRFSFTDENLKDLKRPSDLGSVWNKFRIQTHDKKVSETNGDVLFSHRGALEIPPGRTAEFWMDYQDQGNTGFKMGGDEFVNPLTPGTDYVFTENEDGTGPVLTSSVDVVAEFFTSTCKLTITNNAAVTVHKQVLQGRGTSIRDLSPIWSEASSTQSYGVRTKKIDLYYQHDPIEAKERAEYLEATYRDLSRQIDWIEIHADATPELLAACVGLDVGDVVTVSEEVTGTVDVDGYIQWLEWTLDSERRLTVRYGLAPRIEEEVESDETVTVVDDAGAAIAPPETRIGFARINLSEIGSTGEDPEPSEGGNWFPLLWLQTGE